MAHCGALLRIGMCIRDLQEWNRGTELLMGFTKEEAVGKKLVQNFIADEFSDSVQTMLSQGMNGQELGSVLTKS